VTTNLGDTARSMLAPPERRRNKLERRAADRKCKRRQLMRAQSKT
jgi:hypothetical protein